MLLNIVQIWIPYSGCWLCFVFCPIREYRDVIRAYPHCWWNAVKFWPMLDTYNLCFVVPYVLWHETSVYTVSSVGLPIFNQLLWQARRNGIPSYTSNSILWNIQQSWCLDCYRNPQDIWCQSVWCPLIYCRYWFKKYHLSRNNGYIMAAKLNDMRLKFKMFINKSFIDWNLCQHALSDPWPKNVAFGFNL